MSVFRFGATPTTSTPIPKRMRGKTHRDSSSPTFAFSTSPSLLQDITFDRPEMGVRNSAATGLTMKEYEEQLKKLTAENFNLKLRVYFVEERLSKVNGISDKEDLIKKNIQLKVQCESQAKELEKKQELLFEASKAFELLQKEHKEEIERLLKEKQREVNELQAQASNLEQTLRDLKDGVPSVMSLTDTEACPKSFDEYEKQIADLENNLRLEQMRCRELENTIKDNQLELEAFHIKSERLEKELDQRMQRIEELIDELDHKEQDLNSANFRIRKLEDELNSREREDEILKERIEDKNKAIETLKTSLLTRDSTITALDNRIAKERSTTQSLQSKLDAINFQNSRLKEEVEMLQSRLRRTPDMLSPRSKGRTSDDESYKQKYEDFLRVAEEREDQHAKQIKELEERLFAQNAENVEYQQLFVKYRKLEDDHKKACSALKNFMKRSSEEKKERETLNAVLRSQEEVINELKTQLSRFSSSSSADRVLQDDKLSPSEIGDNERKCGSPTGDKEKCCHEKEKKIQNILSTLEKKENLIQEYEEKISNCSCGIDKKMERISELEAEVVVLKSQLDDKTNDSAKQSLSNELENKRCEIEKLNGELKKRNYNLQELVNKELWDKNRQIEKLEKRLNVIIEKNEYEVMTLNQQISARDQQLKILQDKVGELGITANMPLSLVQGNGLMRVSDVEKIENIENLEGDDVGTLKKLLMKSCDERKYLYKKIEELKEKLKNTPERDCDSKTVQNLMLECQKAKEEVAKSEIFRKEAAQVCKELTCRLEELAGFLDSLLTNRDLLSCIGLKKRQNIVQAIEKSRDLSRHLSLSFVNKALNDTYDPIEGDTINSELGISFSRDKVISEQSIMISKLREQLKYLNQQIKQRDIELSHCQTEHMKSVSDIERDESDLEDIFCLMNETNRRESQWLNGSGDDNVVEDEKKRDTVEISRFEKSCQKTLILPDGKWKSTIATSQEASESEAWSEPDRSVSLARIGLEEISVNISSIRNSKCNDSTESSEGTLNETSRNSVKRSRSSESEVRRLQSKVKVLDEANEALRSELNALKTLKPDVLVMSKFHSNEDSSLGEKLKKTMERLEESRLTIRQLEEKLSDALERASASALELTKATESILFLENQVKRLKEELSAKNHELEESKQRILELDNKIEEIHLESELRILEATKQKEAAEKKLIEVECKLKDAENMSRDVESRVIEIEKQINENKQTKKETYLQFKEAEKHVDNAEKMMEEAERMKIEQERKSKDLQNFADLMRKELEEKMKEAERRIKRAEKEKEEAEKQVARLKRRLIEAEKNKSEVEVKVQKGKETIQRMEEKLREFEIAMDQSNEESQRKIKEIQKKADARVKELEHQIEEREWVRKTENEKRKMEFDKISKEIEIGFKTQLEDAHKMVRKAEENAEMAIKKAEEDFKKQEAELRQKLADLECEKHEICSDLRRQLDEARVEASEYELELTRLTNEKIHLEEELKKMLDKESALVRDHKEIKGKYEKSIHELENKLSQLAMNKSELAVRLEEIESTNIDLVTRISAIRGKETAVVENEISSALSPPPSPLVPHSSLLCTLLNDVELCLPEINGNKHFMRQTSGTSDQGDQLVLGIQSIEAFAPPRRNLNSSPDLGIESDQGRFSSLEAQNQINGDNALVAIGNNDEIKKLESENAELRRRLMKTRQALEETLTQLSAANQRKKQVEKAICKQLHKTHHILKKARVNFEGQDTDSVE